ncbi:NAD(P)H-hydrate dehydratase [Kaarinaea lacus]
MPMNPEKTLPSLLYRAEQVRELDRIAIEEEGTPGMTLMERAGIAAFDEIRRRWPEKRMMGVLCGAGNNGGDGFVVARLAHEAGYKVSVWQVGSCTVGSDAQTAHDQMESAGLQTGLFDSLHVTQQEILVDGLLGTGLSGEIKGHWKEAIDAINEAHQKGVQVLSLDIPSGINADTGAVLGCAVDADCTVTFIGLKQGMFTGAGADHCGDIIFDDLGVSTGLHKKVKPSAIRMDRPDVETVLPSRKPSAHKGDYGHVLVVGGEHGMAGAVRMAGEAAARTGAGLVSLATRSDHAAGIASAVPELMCHGVEDRESLANLIQAASVVAIGPGLGRGQWAQAVFSQVNECPLPLVIDADALNLLAKNPVKRKNWILTPHPGEAARLLGVSVAEIQADRFAAAAAIQNNFGGAVVLKGAGTIVMTTSKAVAICTAGNPGMATGGMGDLLTGILAGLIAQGASIDDAARLGVCLHAIAGDLAAQHGQRGLLASDLLPELRQLMG